MMPFQLDRTSNVEHAEFDIPDFHVTPSLHLAQPAHGRPLCPFVLYKNLSKLTWAHNAFAAALPLKHHLITHTDPIQPVHGLPLLLATRLALYTYKYIHMYIYTFIYVCTYILIYIYIHTQTDAPTHLNNTHAI
jgi:hypothetical protein